MQAFSGNVICQRCCGGPIYLPIPLWFWLFAAMAHDRMSRRKDSQGGRCRERRIVSRLVMWHSTLTAVATHDGWEAPRPSLVPWSAF